MTTKQLREFRLPKADLVKGAYYIGVCRNARIARWDGEKFWHWRLKFGTLFTESIKHQDDDSTFDVFDAIAMVETPQSVKEIPFTGEMEIG